jgi:U3 small nucleolar RNA-associated protein 22
MAFLTVLDRIAPRLNACFVQETPQSSSLCSPLYNNTVIQDIGMLYHNDFLKHHLAQHQALADSLVLLKVWQRKRNLDWRAPSMVAPTHTASRLDDLIQPTVGGLSGFMLAMLVVHLFTVGKVNKLMNSYQVMRSVLVYLSDAKSELYTTGIVMKPYTSEANALTVASEADLKQSLPVWRANFDIVFIDPSHRINIAAYMSRRYVQCSDCFPGQRNSCCRT